MSKDWVELISALDNEVIWPKVTVEEKEVLVTVMLMANAGETQ